MKKIGLLLSLTLISSAACAALETELAALEVAPDTGLVSVTKDKLFSVQTRFAPLKNRHEMSVSMGKNMNQDGHIESNQMGVAYRYHLNDSWAFGANFFKMNNELSPSGKKLLSDKRIVPDRDFVRQQFDLMAEYNLFYGKLRLGMDKVTYFDQYIAAGVGQVALGSSDATAAVLDAGIAFWIGKDFSARMGLKNDFYKEENLSGTTNVHNMVGYLSFGYLLGGTK